MSGDLTGLCLYVIWIGISYNMSHQILNMFTFSDPTVSAKKSKIKLPNVPAFSIVFNSEGDWSGSGPKIFNGFRGPS